MKAIAFVLASLSTLWTLAGCRSTDEPQGDTTLEEMRREIDAVKGDLSRQGLYDCCITPGCDFCALTGGRCTCAHDLSEDPRRPVCPECYAGWRTQHGRIAGVDPDGVEMLSGEMLEKVYDMRVRTRVPKK